MFFATSIILLSAAISVSSVAVPRDATPPAGWWTEGLEDYDVYHARYTALSCFAKHNTTFFASCCHPLLKTETLAKNRAPECNPANLPSSSAPAATPTTDAAAASSAPVNVAPAPSSAAPVNVAPDPTTTSAAPPPAPTTSSPPPPPPTSSAAPAPAPAPPASNILKSGSGGDGTFFYQNNTPGSCGTTHSDSDAVVALDFQTYSPSGDCGSSQFCGKQIVITNMNNGKSVTATVADCCPTCTGPNSVDMSVGAFTQIATEAEGDVPISWKILQ